MAAADAGQYDDPPPPLLREAWQVKRWNVLPEAGGLRDQPAGLLAKYAMLLDYYTANRSWTDALQTQKGEALADWETRNPDVMKQLKRTRELRKALGRLNGK